MDPNQQIPEPPQLQTPPAPNTPAPQQGGQFNPGQYDFIMSPNQKRKKQFLPSGNSKKQRVLVVFIGLVVLLILFMVLYSVLTSGSKANTEQLMSVLQQNTEIVRVSQSANSKVGTDEAKKLSAMTTIVLIGQSQQLQSAMKQKDIKINTKLLNAGRNSKTDQELVTAEANGRYDDAYIQSTRNSLTEYQSTLKSAYNSSSSKSIRELLDEDYKQTSVILESIPASR